MRFKVTIAIPVFNTEPYIERCLRSALNQSLESIEFLLVDDCSTDHTLEKIEAIIEKSPRRKDVTLIKHEANKGIGAIRDTVFRTFQGEYLFFLDGDDELFEFSVEKLYESALSIKSDIVIGSIKFVDTLKRGRDGNWFMSDLISDVPAKLFFRHRFYPMTWNKLYRRGLILDNEISCGPTNQEDEIISLQLFMFADKVNAVSEITYCYYFRKNSISSEFKEDNFKNYSRSIEYLQSLKSRFFDHDYYPEYIKYVYSLKFFLFWRLNKSNLISEEIKLILQKELLISFLSITEIIVLRLPVYERIKLFLPFFPKKLVKLILNYCSPFFKKMEDKLN